MKKIDYVIYIDTDSLYIGIKDFIINNNLKEQFDLLSNNEKIKFLIKISNVIEKYINKHIFEKTQLLDYNSQIKDFKIGFKREIIAKNALFVKKKKYAYWCVDEEGVSVDKISVTGLEVVRSDSAESIKPRLKHIMDMILRQKPEEEITFNIKKYKKELLSLSPEALAANIGVNNLKKYIINKKTIKGTPWHVKGVSNYRNLLEFLNIKNKYKEIYEGTKTKVIYVKKNQFNYETISFYDWPEEFNNIIQPDKKIMIEKFFINKIKMLLNPIKKEYLINGDIKKTLNLFF